MGSVVGIDLGTTYSVVAHITPDGKPEVIPNEFGRPITPSVVYVGDGDPIVGDEAKERQAAGAEDIASFFKRYMGDPSYVLEFNGREYTPVDLSALVLAYLKTQAERHLGTPVTRAVITVPAYFADAQRQATIEAGRRAGLDVLAIISEPTAAALAYGLRPSPQRQRVLVYDLGGGTFDVSLVEIDPDTLRVIATAGDHHLGGRDWDDRLIGDLEAQFESEFHTELVGDDYNHLLVLAEKLKHSLSARDAVETRIQAGGHTAAYTMTRARFESLTSDLIGQTRQLADSVVRDAGLAWQDIDGIIPVGGSTRMPMVRECIHQMSGKPPLGGANPDEAVALGAAIYAALETERALAASAPLPLLPGRKAVQDVIAHSLGMIAESQDRSRYVNSHLILKNSPIPVESTRPYSIRLRRDGKDHIDVFLTQGESKDPRECVYLDRYYVLSGFSPVGDSEVVVVDITYAYDHNGIVRVTAREQSSGTSLQVTGEPLPPDVPARFFGEPSRHAPSREFMTLYLALDLSGSMRGTPLEEAKRAARAFVAQCDPRTTAIGLISFSDKVAVDLTATNDTDGVLSGIERLAIGKTGGGNAGQPFDNIYRELITAQGRRFGVVLTDGRWSKQHYAVDRAQRCHAERIEIIGVGFGNADRRFLEQITSASQQSIFTDLEHLSEAFISVARELSSQSMAEYPVSCTQLRAQE